MGTGEHATWNNETDAFKHAYMQAHSRIFYGKPISISSAYLHERNGNKYQGQSKGEENMDFWNNKIGQEIGEEIEKIYKEITAQANSSIGIPARKDLEKAEQTGGVIYVKSYTRSDGTQVKGYFRSRTNI